jgi:hypothetical protein
MMRSVMPPAGAATAPHPAGRDDTVQDNKVPATVQAAQRARGHHRFDRLTAVLIEAVINKYGSGDLPAAARALAAQGVSLDTALRVLTRPWLRRQSHTGPRGCSRAG